MMSVGTFRATYLVALSCIGSFLFAYDTGIVGGVLTLDSFIRDVGVSSNDTTTVSSLSASLLQAGAFFSCFFVWPITARYGRRIAIVLAALIFDIGAILQLFPNGGVATWYAGRVIAGVGIGIATVIVPLYTAEMAPKSIRGQLGSMFQFFFTLGVMTSYWVDYGVSRMPSSTKQWRIPVGLQLVPGGALCLGMLLVKESTRWLAKKGRHDEAMASLVWVRGGDTPDVHAEMAEILAGIREEELQTEGLTWKEYLLPANRFRLFVAVTLQIGVQLTGNTSLAYFSPQVFASVGAGSNALFFSGFFGVAKAIACFLFLSFLVERIGRRGALTVGAALMGALFLIIAVLTVTHPPNPDGGLSSTSVASLVMIYLEAMVYNMSWGPVPWLYTAEIFPNRIREGGVALATATQWLFNFVFSQITPHAVNNLKWRTFLMFAIFNWALVVYVWFFIKETKGRSLEEMELIFNAKSARRGLEQGNDKSGRAVEHIEDRDGEGKGSVDGNV